MNALRQYRTPLLTAAVLLFVTATYARADQILFNGNFDTPYPNNSRSVLSGVDHQGWSAAAHWSTWNNSLGTTYTSLVKSTFPGGGTNMIHVQTTGRGNGIVQGFAHKNTGPTNVLSSIWVYVVSGQVTLATGNGGDVKVDVVSTKTNTWERLQAYNGVSPANELNVYSHGGAANFYVANASVSISSGHTAGAPEPSALVLSTLGALVTFLGKSYRRKGASKRL